MEHPTEQWPRPKAAADEEPAIRWPSVRSLACPVIDKPRGRDFCDVALVRRAARTMRPGSFRDVVNTVAFATGARQIMDGDSRRRSRRISPSAGALHPVEIALVPFGGNLRVCRYDTFEHRLDILRVADLNALMDFKTACLAVLPEGRAASIVLLGRLARVSTYYDDALPLLWRDAGAVMQSICLTATAFDLGSCPLGMLGHELVTAIGMNAELVPLGVIQIGQPIFSE